jgi:hypothetical protein
MEIDKNFKLEEGTFITSLYDNQFWDNSKFNDLISEIRLFVNNNYSKKQTVKKLLFIYEKIIWTKFNYAILYAGENKFLLEPLKPSNIGQYEYLRLSRIFLQAVYGFVLNGENVISKNYYISTEDILGTKFLESLVEKNEFDQSLFIDLYKQIHQIAKLYSDKMEISSNLIYQLLNLFEEINLKVTYEYQKYIKPASDYNYQILKNISNVELAMYVGRLYEKLFSVFSGEIGSEDDFEYIDDLGNLLVK